MYSHLRARRATSPLFLSLSPFPPFLPSSRNVLRNGSIVKDISASLPTWTFRGREHLVFLVNIRSIKVEVFRRAPPTTVQTFQSDLRKIFFCSSRLFLRCNPSIFGGIPIFWVISIKRVIETRD